MTKDRAYITALFIKVAAEVGLAIATPWLMPSHPLLIKIQIGALCFMAGANFVLAITTLRKAKT